ncbi:MAG: Gfo/Idh/MocA family oxidoreductase [Ruminococcaceae bacterium]|nr:Gfo/Idh/MocA family oxidoreductase [Oscillospiraceae bacterium]
MKACIIGYCGHWYHPYSILNNMPDVEICGVAPGHPRENQVSPLDPSVPFYTDYRQMLDETNPDLAIISPVFGLTGKIIIECANRGLDIFAEKPVASSLEELDAVKRAVKENKIRFSAMHYLRYNPAFYQAAEMVRNNAIGEVKMITGQKSYRYGTRPEWYGDRELYGGTIPWVGIHAIDWVAHFSGKRMKTVTAQSIGKDPEMAALCQFTLEDGVIASVNIDYYRPSTAPTHGDDRVRCVGTEGVIEVRDGKILLINKDGCSEYIPAEAPDLFKEFISGKDPIPVDEIFHITGAAIAARDSADTGKTIRIEDGKEA